MPPAKADLEARSDALSLVESIPGWLRAEDAAKLYELSQAISGPILEIGTHRGKSTMVMALAARASQRPTTIYTVDVDRGALDAAAAEARVRGLTERIVFIRGTSSAFARGYPHVHPRLTFVDGDHSRSGVERDLAVLEAIVPVDGLMLFHDFHDPRNDDPACDEIGVRPAVESSWVARQCDFEGVFGVCGLFRRREEPNPNPDLHADLMRLASVHEQYLHRLRYPAGHLWRRMRRMRRGGNDD